VQVSEVAAGALKAFEEVSIGDHRIKGTIIGIYEAKHYR
jgi:hypothetical protein